MRAVRRTLATTVAAAALALAACSSDDGVPTGDDGDPTAAEGGDVATGSAEPDRPDGDLPEPTDLPDLVGRLPTARTDRLVVQAADLGVAAEVAGVEHPPTARRQWALDLTTGSPQTGVHVPLPPGFRRELQAGVDPELGWSVADATAFAYVGAPPEESVLLTGVDEDAAADTVEPLEGGILTVGRGADHEFDGTATTPLRQLGAPLRLAFRDDTALVTTTTSAARTFLTEQGATLAQDEAVTGVVAALADAFALSVLAPPMSADTIIGPVLDPGAQRPPLVTAPPLAVGLGSVATDGGVRLLAVYRFTDPATAGSQVEHVSRVWQEGTVDGQRPVTELVELEEVGQDGATVVAVLAPVQGLAAQHLDPASPRGALPFAW